MHHLLSTASERPESRTEELILAALVSHLIECDCALSVNDGEATTIKRSTDAAAVLKALRSTDDDWLIISRQGARLGSIYFVYGNAGHDVINDYSCSLDDLMEPVNAYADWLSEQPADRPVLLTVEFAQIDFALHSKQNS